MGALRRESGHQSDRTGARRSVLRHRDVGATRTARPKQLRLCVVPVLRRLVDHCRNLRRRAPRALAIVDPDQDRRVMTVAALPAAQRRFPSPPAARRSRKAMSSQGRRSSSKRRVHAKPAHDRPRKPCRLRFHREQCAPPAAEAPTTLRPRPQNPHRSRCAQPNSAPPYPRFPPYEAFGRRPRPEPRAPAKGRRPKPFS